MAKSKGFTLVEVIVSIGILSMFVVVFLTVMGQGTLLLSRGTDYTQETYRAQEDLENDMASTKEAFINGDVTKDFDVTVFSGKYKSTVNLIGVTKTILHNRAYTTYLSDYEIIEPLTPSLSDFVVDVYKHGTNTPAFPWYDDNIDLKATYTVNSVPTIYQTRERWYMSRSDEDAPVFPSSYDTYYEVLKDLPVSGTHTNTLVETGAYPIVPERFYWFEARPFTVEGRVAFYKSPDRILVLQRNGTPYWQTFMEDIYFDRIDRLNDDVYVDIMQFADWPTLDVDSKSNEDPEGSLIWMDIPSAMDGKSFETQTAFKFDADALAKDTTLLGAGVSIVNDNDSGYMVTLDPINNELRVNQLYNGNYASGDPLATYDLSSDPAFAALLKTIEGSKQMDWNELYYLDIDFYPTDKKITLKVFYTDDDGNIIASTPVDIAISTTVITPTKVGFKGYSENDYINQNPSEITDQYDREYNAHFYNIDFSELSSGVEEDDVVDIILKKNFFVYGSKIKFDGSTVIGHNASMYISNKEGTFQEADINGGALLDVSNIYISGKVSIDSGSASIGCQSEPGEIHINNDTTFGTGTRNLYGDIYINGNFYIGQAIVHGNVYVNGDFGVGAGIGRDYSEFLSMPGHIYYTGSLKNIPSYFTPIDSRFPATKVDSAPLPKIPNLDIPICQEDAWYSARGYGNTPSVKPFTGMRVIADSYAYSNWFDAVENVIIVAKTGDISITGGGTKVKGILFAPNGQVNFKGSEFDGLVIAKNGFYVTSGGSTVRFISAYDLGLIDTDIPFKAPTK